LIIMLASLLVLGVLAFTNDGADAASEKRVHVTLLGSTGNLAGKYLWQAMYNMYLENELAGAPVELDFVGAGREAADVGGPVINSLIENNVKCLENTPGFAVCSDASKAEFVKRTRYAQMKKDEHYKALCDGWNSPREGYTEAGRLFYLSVPPFAYQGITDSLKAHCIRTDNFAPNADGSVPWARVAYEKPFGSDLASAKEQAAGLGAALNDDEIYRVDHYLGKAGVKQIQKFRDSFESNEAWKQLWNANSIESVKVVMKETEDCEGRTGFYDAYGVLRDVHQNHLTEVLSLVMADEAADPAADTPKQQLERKAAFLNLLTPGRVRVLQYDGYISHVQQDNKDPAATSQTPTLGSTEIYVAGVGALEDIEESDQHSSSSARWEGVPIVILGGKGLDERRAYVSVQFKSQPGENPEDYQLVFHIQGGEPKRGPYIAVGKGLPTPTQGLSVGGDAAAAVEKTIQTEDAPWASHVINAAAGADRPYDRLLWAMLQGQQADFVGTDGLLASWKVWDQLLQKSMGNAPELYAKGLDINTLNLLEPDKWDAATDGTPVNHQEL